MNHYGPLGWRPDHSYRTGTNPPQSRITLAHALPLPLLMNAIGHAGMRLLSSEYITRAVLVGAKKLPVLVDNALTRQGELILCKCGCWEGSTGTYTLIADVEMIEILANGQDPREKYPRCSAFEASNGRVCYVVPGSSKTQTPWLAG